MIAGPKVDAHVRGSGSKSTDEAEGSRGVRGPVIQEKLIKVHMRIRKFVKILARDSHAAPHFHRTRPLVSTPQPLIVRCCSSANAECLS